MEHKAQDSDRVIDDDAVMNLVELALDLPEPERRAYLQNACGDQSQLFEHAWEYVQWESRMQGFLLDPLYPPPLNEHPFAPGELLDGRFRILREVAQGGMGVVYEALDEKLDRRIAIKCAKTGFRQRLPPEVRHARDITHPNVCKIFEIHTAHTAAAKIDFVTMEYLEGETLADRLKRGRLEEPEARVVARQLCSGLAEAHRKGVIHGDLKSNNVILTEPAGASTRSVITDFGMSRAAESAQSTLQTGPRGGTPDYMAPELLRGEKASAASDVYALGVILHELVGGRKPAAGAPIAVHPKWNAIVTKCLAANPQDRWAGAAELAQAFEPPRSRRLFLMTAAAILVAALTGVVTYRRPALPREVVRLAVLPFDSTPGVDLNKTVTGLALASLRNLSGTAKIDFRAISLPPQAGSGGMSPGQARSALNATHVMGGNIEKQGERVLLRGWITDLRSGVRIRQWSAEYPPNQIRYAGVALAGLASEAFHLPPVLSAVSENQAGTKNYLAGMLALRSDSAVDHA